MKKIASVLSFALLLANPCMANPFGVKPEDTRALQALNARIAADPKNANLYLKRCDLQTIYMNYDDAVADQLCSI